MILARLQNSVGSFRAVVKPPQSLDSREEHDRSYFGGSTSKKFLFWCPYMAIDVSVQYNGGFLPEIILLTQCDNIGEPFLIPCRVFVVTANVPTLPF